MSEQTIVESACDTLRSFIDAGLAAVTYDEAINAHAIIKEAMSALAALELELAEARAEAKMLRESAKCGAVGDASVAAARGADGPGSPSPTDPVAAALAIIDNPTGVGDKAWLLTVYMPAAKVRATAERARLR